MILVNCQKRSSSGS